jgi:hypothetical protein
MVCGFATHRRPSWQELQHAVMRNFGGLDSVKPLDVFQKHLKHVPKDVKVSVLLQFISFIELTDMFHVLCSMLRAVGSTCQLIEVINSVH